jgi:hypothetical protein
MANQHSSFGQDFYPRGWLKVLAILLIFSTTLLPAVISWKNGPGRDLQMPSRFGPGFGSLRQAPALEAGQPVSSRLPIGQTILAVVGSVVGLALYYPKWGFKRYALLAGPVLGIGAMYFLNGYLEGRQTVHRVEIVFGGLLGSLPGCLFYTWLARRKWRRKNPPDSIWIE